MWVPRFQRASRGDLRRIFSLLAATLVVALFVVLGPLTQQTHALSAIWSGNTLTYDGQTYKEVTAPPNMQGMKEYEWIDTAANPDKAYVLYFADNPQAQTKATLKTYSMPGYGTLDAPVTIDVTRDLTVDANDQNQTSDNATGTTCSGDITKGLGWILCPVSNYLADGVDSVYKIIEDFLEVRPILEQNDGIYQLWDLVRSIANVCFVIAFLVIIYSQITGAGLSNYNVKTMVPRLIIGAILLNLSFVITGLAVDASNLLGHSIQAILVGIRENVAMTTPDLMGISWTQFTNALLAGGAGTVGVLGFAAATGGSITSLLFILLGMLITAGLSVLVAFAILAARQALITIFVIISPLAFVAFVLPSTNQWFEKWRKAFTTLLLFFPIFAMLFGGAQLAGTAIINAEAQAGQDARLHIILIGLAVQVIPLALTPLIVRFSTGLLGTVAQFANNSKRGLVDRAKNWSTDNADYHKKRKQAKTAYHARPGFRRNLLDARGIGRLGLAMDQGKRNRELSNKDSDALLANRAERNWERRHDDPLGLEGRPTARFGQRNRYNRLRAQRHLAHDYHKQAETYRQNIESEGDEHWSHNLHGAHGDYARLRNLRGRTHTQKETAALYEGRMDAADDRHFQQLVNREGTNLHDLRVATATDKGIAELNKAQVDAYAENSFRQQVLASRDMRQMAVQTADYTKRAELAKSEVDKRAEAHVENLYKTDGDIKSQKLRVEQLDGSIKQAQEQWNTIIENVRAKGATAPGITAADASAANSIKQLTQDIAVQKEAQSSAQIVQQQELLEAYKASETLRTQAGGIDDGGATRVYAKARSGIVSAYMENVKNSRSLLSEYTANELFRLQNEGIDRNNNNVAENSALRDAALQELMLSKGNNWAYQKLNDNIAINNGMIYDEQTGEYYEPVRDANEDLIYETVPALDSSGNPIRNPDGSPKMESRPRRGNQITDQKRIDRNRDVQQLFIDAAKQSKLNLGHMSGTDMSAFESGLSITTGKQAILRDMATDKFSESRWASADIDELMRTVEILRDPTAFDYISDPVKRAKVKANTLRHIDKALSNPLLQDKIKGRERGVLNSIAAYLDPNDTRTNQEKESIYYTQPDGTRATGPGTDITEESISVGVPRQYSRNRLNDYSDGTGPS